MRKFFTHYWYILLLSAAGVIGGFLYWRFVGCNTGSCPITSNWHYSTLFGGLTGYLGGSTIQDILKKRSSH